MSKNDMSALFESLKLLLSMVAAYVGIRAVINSSKSASLSAESVKIASESINFNKEKEMMEQTSHLIVISLVEEVNFISPLYIKSDPKIEISKKALKEGRLHDNLNKMRGLFYKKTVFIHHFEIFNSGKGAAINVEYKFRFKKLDLYDNYFFNTPNDLMNHNFPNYEFQIRNLYDTRFITMKDLRVMNDLNQVANEVRHFSTATTDKTLLSSGIDDSLPAYKNIIKTKENETFHIPNEFIILCKHYANLKIIQEKVKNMMESNINVSELPTEFDFPKPEAEIIISYSDEYAVRTGEYSFDKKTELKYNVTLKDDFTLKNKESFDLYIDINLSQPEKLV